MLNFDLQNHRPLREIVYEQLKMQILQGIIEPGTRMMEVELAEDMGVSRTPVREAIRKLEKEGLVTIEPRRGAYASEISLNDMVDTLEVREDLEGLAASLAAARITPEQVKELEDITARYREAIEAKDTENMIRYDEIFHKYIVSCAENDTLSQITGTVQELALRFRYFYYDDFSRYESMPGEHRAILAAISSGDSDVARETAEKHVNHLKTFVESQGNKVFKNL